MSRLYLRKKVESSAQNHAVEFRGKKRHVSPNLKHR